MKYTILTTLSLLIFHFGINAQNIEGEYTHYISKVLGAYRISMESTLELKKIDNNTYNYTLTETVIDEYNGGTPSTKSSNGKLNKLSSLKFKFNGGSLGEKGAYISFKIVPKPPINNVSVFFAPGRGDTRYFTKKTE